MGSTQELVDFSSEVLSSTNDLETELCIIQECIKSADGGSYSIRKIQISQKTLDTQVNLLRFIVKNVQKLVNLPSSLFITYNKIWFEGPYAEVYEKLVFAEEEINGDSILTDTKASGKLKSESDSQSVRQAQPTFLCISTKSNDDSYVTLEEWLMDRDNVILYQIQIVHVVKQVLSLLVILVEKGITESNFSTSDIHVFPQFGQNLLPTIKLGKLEVENLETALLSLCHGNHTNAHENGLSSTHHKLENWLQSATQTFAELIQRTVGSERKLNQDEIEQTVNNAEVLELLKEMVNSDGTNESVKVLIAKLGKIKEKYLETVLLGLTEPKKKFIGREYELSALFKLLTNKDPKNSVIILQGPSGNGKSELVNQLAQIFTRDKGICLCLNASSVDSLTSAVYNFASHPSLNVSIRDYIGNPRGIRNLFGDMIQSFSDKNLMIVIENAETPTEEVLDLIQVFKETVASEEAFSSCHNLLIVTRNPSWNNSTMGEYTTTSLPNLNSSESLDLLAKVSGCIIPSQETELEVVRTLAEKLEHIPQSLELISLFIKHYSEANEGSSTTTNIYNCVLELLQNFKDRHTEIESLNTALGVKNLVYSFVLSQLFESLNEEDKQTIRNILYILQYIDGNFGIAVDILIKLLIQFDPTQADTVENQVTCSINTLRKFGLIRVRDKTVYLSLCNQESLKEVVAQMFKPDLTLNSQNVLSALKTVLQYITSDEPHRSWKLIPHAAKIWTVLTGNNLNHAKQFDAIPELIATTAKTQSKFEEVTEFLNKAIKIFTAAYGSLHDSHVLKLKFLISEESLLKKSRMNEAFTIFKTINEQSHAEPKDSLMLKLNSLIHLGRIHITRQEYEKAISCFQQVQILAVQKISRLQLDSEPIVLKARMLHGYAYLQQNNLEEGKKIFLQVIPLLERYSGPDSAQIRGLITDAKFYLATLLRKNGDLVNALMMQTKVLEERERVFGRKHPDTWSSKQEMAMLYSSYDNHDKALLLLREVLEIQEEVLGAPSNRQSLQTMNAIAEIEAKLGNFDDALELYEAIDLIEQQVLGESDEMRISSQLKQADVLVVLGQYKEAIDIFDLLIALQSSTLEENSGKMKRCEEIVAKREKADRSMEIVGNYWFGLTPDNLNNPSDLDTLAKKHEVAMELCENQDHHGALRFLREVLEDCTHLDDTNRFHLNVKADLARVLGLVGKFNESFSVYKEIIPLLDATFGECDELTMLCKDTMGQVFLFSGNQFLKRQMSNLKWFLL
ncbi:unnamed protein product [Orchesella dallaii]|uniref:Nephrocystin-3 n=1 Tax=Orchesella dallaii TaxID=48710 RepID=A0ABP1QFH8_9HEXA